MSKNRSTGLSYQDLLLQNEAIRAHILEGGPHSAKRLAVFNRQLQRNEEAINQYKQRKSKFSVVK